MKNNVNLLQNAHQQSKSIFFEKRLPFYTCIDVRKNKWEKELSDGTTIIVKLTFDWEKDETKEEAFILNRQE